MKSKNEVEIENLESKKTFSANDIIAILIFLSYFLVDFIPSFGSYSFAEPQWLFLNLLNLLVSGYLFYEKSYSENLNWTSFLKNKIVALYIGFTLLSGMSILVAFNLDEAVISFIKLLIALICFFNLYILFRDRTHTFLTLSVFISILLFIQCYIGLSHFFELSGSEFLLKLKYEFVHKHGNKNIFAANILVKIPFVFYCISKYTNWKRVVFIIILITSFVTMFILSARALNIGLIMIVLLYAVFHLLIFKNNTEKKSILISVMILIVSFIFSFLISNLILKKADVKLDITEKSYKNEVNSTNRLASVSLKDSSLVARLHYWKSAGDCVLKKPTLGCGLGNWKIESLPYEHQWITSDYNALFSHNDFLQVAAESGIVTGLAYISLFVLLFFMNIKNILKNPILDNFSVFILLALIGYSVDSFFNFPLSRPTMQVIFVILLLFTIINVSTEFKILNENKVEETSKKSSSKYLLIFLGLSLITVYPMFLNYVTFTGLKIVADDKKDLKLSSQTIMGLFPSFPDLDHSGEAIDDIKAKYLIKENRYDDALIYLKSSALKNPNSLRRFLLTEELYSKIKQTDSILKYNKILFQNIPNFSLYYEKYIQSESLKRDTTSILKAFKKVDTLSLKPQHFASTFKFLLDSGYDPNKGYGILKKGIQKFPNDTLLSRLSNDFIKISKTIQAKQPNKPTSNTVQIQSPPQTTNYNVLLNYYLNAFNTNPNDIASAENVGVCYYQLKKYKLALPFLDKVINSKILKTGKSEYTAAASCYLLKDKKNACKYAKKAAELNYPGAKDLINANCN